MLCKFRIAAAMVAGVVAVSAHAADHLDGPALLNDPAADINDVFAFINPNDARELILAATVLPLATSESRFSDAVLYRFNLQNAAAGSPRLAIDCRFRGRKVRCTGPGRMRVKARIGQVKQGRGMRVFAGLRDDPFYFDLVAYQQTVNTLMPQFSDPGVDFFEGLNTLAIVIGLDADRFAVGKDSRLLVYASTLRDEDDDSDDDSSDDDSSDDDSSDDDSSDDDSSDDDSSDDDSSDDDSSDDDSSDDRENNGRRGHELIQVDRMGRPAINTALIDLLVSTGKKDQYNQAADIETWAPLFEAEIAANLAALDTLDGVVGNNLLPPDTLASVLVDDRLVIDVSIPVCDAYLAVELGVAQCGGRTLQRDIIDDTFGAVVGPGVSDFVGNTSLFLDVFPFLGEPNQ